MTDMKCAELADFAAHLARLGGAVLLHFQRQGFRTESKAQGELVTVADRTCEALLVREIREHYPSHGILGEETGLHAGASEFLWVLDPLDGTHSYSAAFPMYGVCVALLEQGMPVIGAIFLPVFDHLYLGQPGVPSTCNGREIRVRTAPPDQHAIIGIQSGSRNGQYPPFIEMLYRNYSTRAVGTAAGHLAYVADGTYAAAADLRCRLWDIAAGYPLVIGAGGRMSATNGEPLFPLNSPPESYLTRRMPWFAAAASCYDELQTRMFPEDTA